MKRLMILICAALAVCALGGLPTACGNGDKPAIEPSTLYPSASGSGASPGSSPGAATASPGATTLTPSTAPTNSGSEITDASIKANILRRIAESPTLAGLRIRVFVRDKSVSLRGNVTSADQKTEVEQIARTEPGIVKVVSHLVVEPNGDGGY